MGTTRLEELNLVGNTRVRDAARGATVAEPDALARRRAAAGGDDGAGAARAGEPDDRRCTLLELSDVSGLRECGSVGGGNERNDAEEGLELHLE